jgi:hypothetical protein
MGLKRTVLQTPERVAKSTRQAAEIQSLSFCMASQISYERTPFAE